MEEPGFHDFRKGLSVPHLSSFSDMVLGTTLFRGFHDNFQGGQYVLSFVPQDLSSLKAT